MNSTPVQTPGPASARLESVDLLRGLVMVIMALDHTRDFFHVGALHGIDPGNLAVTTPALFFTRWVTHFCAPIFSFLAGTGIYLAAQRGKSKSELSRFLVTRGLWLIFIELTYGYWAMNFSFGLHFNLALVLWQLGWSMIVLGALIHLPLWAIATFGLTLILGHNAFDAVRPQSWGSFAWLWQVLHVQSIIRVTPSFTLLIAYPLIPWLGVMATGYAFGSVYQLDAATRRTWLIRLGLALTMAFVLLRFSNLYGDPGKWAAQPQTGFTLISFLNLAKYPPSLLFLLMTLGPGMIFLGLFDGATPEKLKCLLVFGRVPFFYYFLHFTLIHALAALWHQLQYGRADLGTIGAAPAPPGAGDSLPVVYLIWIGVVLAVYPVCRWFAELKRRRRDLTWLSYL